MIFFVAFLATFHKIVRYAHSKKCWVVSTQIWVKYGQTKCWVKNVIKKYESES